MSNSETTSKLQLTRLKKEEEIDREHEHQKRPAEMRIKEQETAHWESWEAKRVESEHEWKKKKKHPPSNKL